MNTPHISAVVPFLSGFDSLRHPGAIIKYRINRAKRFANKALHNNQLSFFCPVENSCHGKQKSHRFEHSPVSRKTLREEGFFNGEPQSFHLASQSTIQASIPRQINVLCSFYHTNCLNIEHSFCCANAKRISTLTIVKNVHFFIAGSWGLTVRLCIFLGNLGRLWVNRTT